MVVCPLPVYVGLVLIMKQRWYTFAVDRAFRRRGIGRDLVRHVFAKAKAAGVPVAVSSEPQAYAFFIKMGFEETKSVEMDLAQWAPPYSGFGAFRLRSMICNP